MVKNDEFDSAIKYHRGEIAVIRVRLSDMKNDVIQALREENISLKNWSPVWKFRYNSRGGSHTSAWVFSFSEPLFLRMFLDRCFCNSINIAVLIM